MPAEPLDPLTQLRRPLVPMAPRAAFATDLRARLEHALGPMLSSPSRRTNPISTSAPRSAPMDTPTLTPYLAVNDGAAAIAWYVDVLGAFEQLRFTGDDGRVGHAELTIGPARVFLADEYPEIGVLSPTSLGGTSVSLHLEVVDGDNQHPRAEAAGATSQRPPADQAHGNRTATIVDPFGHRWMLSQPIAALSAREMDEREPAFTVTGATDPVELGYLTMHRADTARAATFFGALFGWALEPGNSGEAYRHVANTKLPMGFAPSTDGDDAGTVRLYFRVDDVDAYAARVVALGGQVLLRAEYESGGNAECVDDQGARFDLFQPAPGY